MLREHVQVELQVVKQLLVEQVEDGLTPDRRRTTDRTPDHGRPRAGAGKPRTLLGWGHLPCGRAPPNRVTPERQRRASDKGRARQDPADDSDDRPQRRAGGPGGRTYYY